jgi:hypothetical protein
VQRLRRTNPGSRRVYIEERSVHAANEVVGVGVREREVSLLSVAILKADRNRRGALALHTNDP